MTDRWTHIRQLFRAALEVDANARDAFLDARCPDDPELRARVAAMLEAYGDDDTFLETPIVPLDKARNVRSSTAQLVGTHVGPYLIKRAIAEGGMGVVFEALDTKLEKIVALKMMSPALMQDASFKKRFEQEARTLALLEDPHFVRVYALIEEGERTFIVMEYVNGITLAERIKARGSLSAPEVAGIGIQLLTALDKAHKRHIVHRDLKPSNIMLTRTDEGKSLVKVLDFGIAKQILAGDNQTRTLGTVGTLYYMSPEQVRSLPTIDHRTDIYSTGVTLYEALNGALPFDVTKDEFMIRKQIVEGLLNRTPLLPANEARGTASQAGAAAVSDVLARALATDPDERYQTAEAMRQALRNTVEEWRARKAAAPPAPPPAARPPDRSPAAASSAAADPQPGMSARRLPLRTMIFVFIVLVAIGVTLRVNLSSEPSGPSSQTEAETPGEAESAAPVPSSDPASPGENRLNTAAAPAAQGDSETVGDTAIGSETVLPIQNEVLSDEEVAEDATESPAAQEQTGTDPDRLREDPGDSTDRNLETLDDTLLAETTEPDSAPAPPPSTIPAERRQGSVTFFVRPQGDVLVDGTLRAEGITVQEIPLLEDTYRLSVVNDQYGAWMCDRQVLPGQNQDLQIRFEETIAITVVAIQTQDGVEKPLPNANIIIDGAPTGYETPMKVSLSPGLHTFEVQADGYTQTDVVADGAKGCYQVIDHRINLNESDITGTPATETPPRIVVYLEPTSSP